MNTAGGHPIRSRQPATRGPAAPTARGGFVSQATFNGLMGWTEAPRAVVARCLPPELRLPIEETGDTYPLLFIAGDQTRGTSRYAGVPLNWGTWYQELIVLVPRVRVRRTGLLGHHSVAMLSSYELPNWVGRVSYGFPKRLGSGRRLGEIQVFSTPEEGVVFQATPQAMGRAARAAPGSLAALEGLCRLPWLGMTEGGRCVRSYSDWCFDRAVVTPARGLVQVHSALCPRLPDLKLSLVPEASWVVEGMTWKLSWPRSVPA